MTQIDTSPRITSQPENVLATLRVQIRVIGAIILRDMGTRFGSSPLSYVIAILWPTTHVGLLLGIYSVLGRQPSYGTDLVIWVVTGALPFVIFVYPFRNVSAAVSDGRPLLSFPVVKPIDLVLARITLEFLTASVYATVLYVGLSVMGWNIEVYHVQTALMGLLSAFFLGISMAIFMTPLAMLFSRAILIANLFIILLWASCGILYLPDSAPEPIKTYISYNPLLHAIELFRTGMYFDYHSELLNPSYLFLTSICLMTIGLVGERVVRVIKLR